MTSSKEVEVVESTPFDDVAVSDEVIQEVYDHLKTVVVKHVHNYMLEIGQYLVEKFYGDYETAQKKKFTQTESMKKLIDKIKSNISEGEGNIPSRTWIYDSVNLSIDYHLYQQKKLPSAYGKLGHSHKVALTHAPTPEIKIALIEELDKKNSSVDALKDRISKERLKIKTDYVNIDEEIPENKLESFSLIKLRSLRKRTTTLKDEHTKQLQIYSDNLENIKSIIDIKEEEAKEKAKEEKKKKK